MARPLPKFDEKAKFATVFPIDEHGAAFVQGGYRFTASKQVITACFDDIQKERHFGTGALEDKTLKGSTTLGDVVDLGNGASMQHEALVQVAFRASNLVMKEWNALPDADRDEMIEETRDLFAGKITPAAPQPRPAMTVGKIAAPAEETPPAATSEAEKPQPKMVEPPAPAKPKARAAPAKPAKGAKTAFTETEMALWLADETRYPLVDVLRGIATKFNKKCRTAQQARDFLDEMKIKPATL